MTGVYQVKPQAPARREKGFVCHMREENETHMRLFVDIDGVLADFDAHYEAAFGVASNKELDDVDWAKVAARGDFYLDIPPMTDMTVLWEAYREAQAHRAHRDSQVGTGGCR